MAHIRISLARTRQSINNQCAADRHSGWCVRERERERINTTETDKWTDTAFRFYVVEERSVSAEHCHVWLSEAYVYIYLFPPSPPFTSSSSRSLPTPPSRPTSPLLSALCGMAVRLTV